MSRGETPVGADRPAPARDEVEAALLALLQEPWRSRAPSVSAPAPVLAAALDLGVQAGVGPLVAARLLSGAGRNGADRGGLDPETRERAFRLRAGALVGREALLRHLRQALGALEAAGVPAVAFKGPAFAELAYEDPAVRASLDLDVWVPRPALGSALQALAAPGWRPLGPLEPGELGSGSGLELGGLDMRPSIDLHTALAKTLAVRRSPEPDPRRHVIRLGGSGVATFDPAWTLAIAAIHLHQDVFELSRLVDLAACLGRTSDEDARRGLEVAARFGLSGVLLAGARLASALGAPRRPSLSGAPPTLLLRALARTGLARLLPPRRTRGMAPRSVVLRLVATWALLDRPLDGVERAGRLAFPPRPYVRRRGGAVRRALGIARRLTRNRQGDITPA